MKDALKFGKYTVTDSHDGAINSKEFCTRFLHFVERLVFLTKHNILDSTYVSSTGEKVMKHLIGWAHYKFILIKYTVQWFKVAYSK